MQSYANPQSFNRYSYVWNNPLKYTDPSGLIVELESEIELQRMLEELALYGMDYAQGSPVEEMIQDAIDDRLEWETLRGQEPEYTQHMIDSELTFTISGIDLPSQTIDTQVNLPEIASPDPMQLRFVKSGEELDFMKNIDAGAISRYPGPISIRTDPATPARSTAEFTWLVGHESFHRYEQSSLGVDFPAWYFGYIVFEAWRLPDLRPSEIRANNYSDRYFKRK